MATQNGSVPSEMKHHLLEEQLDAFKAGVRRWIDTVAVKPEGKSRLRHFIDRTGAMIKEHPIAAVTVAFGVGYIVVRIARR